MNNTVDSKHVYVVLSSFRRQLELPTPQNLFIAAIAECADDRTEKIGPDGDAFLKEIGCIEAHEPEDESEDDHLDVYYCRFHAFFVLFCRVIRHEVAINSLQYLYDSIHRGRLNRIV